jgi:hypothetical protein
MRCLVNPLEVKLAGQLPGHVTGTGSIGPKHGPGIFSICFRCHPKLGRRGTDRGCFLAGCSHRQQQWAGEKNQSQTGSFAKSRPSDNVIAELVLFAGHLFLSMVSWKLEIKNSPLEFYIYVIMLTGRFPRHKLETTDLLRKETN